MGLLPTSTYAFTPAQTNEPHYNCNFTYGLIFGRTYLNSLHFCNFCILLCSLKESVKQINKIFKSFYTSLKNKLGKVTRSGSHVLLKAGTA